MKRGNLALLLSSTNLILKGRPKTPLSLYLQYDKMPL